MTEPTADQKQKFLDSGKPCDDLGTAIDDDSMIGMRGRLYCDILWIAENTDEPGKWWTTIGNQTPHGTLEVCEAELLEFAVSEGYV